MPPKSPRTFDAVDTAALLKEWKDETVGLTRDVTEACEKLNQAKIRFEDSTSSWRKLFDPKLVLGIFTVVVLAILAYGIPSFHIELGSVKITKNICQDATVQPKQ